MLRVRHTITTLHICIDEVAMAAINIIQSSLLTRIDAALDVELTIVPVRQAHVGLLTVAVNGCLDSSSVVIGLDSPARRDRGSGSVCYDVYVMIYEVSVCYGQLVQWRYAPLT
jgi:hypothetical protein